MDILNLKKVFNEKTAIIIYLLILIFINILDFFNLLVGDIDFLEKLTSWIAIAYLFYHISITKVFIGIRNKLYDIILIVGFSLMVIPKSILQYVITNQINKEFFFIFYYFLNWISKFNFNELLIKTFLLGIFIITLITIVLVINYKNKKGLVGSILNNRWFNNKITSFLVLLFLLIFFSMTAFNFFMEWFALAVDAIILVIGLIYYAIKYIKITFKNKFVNFLENVSNSGNDFFENVISMFSNKKTFFIALSLILTLHTLVDGGVYLVPYSIGTDNSFYFIDGDVENHRPLLNFFEYENSNLYNDLTKVDLFWKYIFLPLVYLSNLLLFYVFLIFPFYILYKNINNENINLNSKLLYLFFFSSIIFISVSYMGFQNPLGFGKSFNSNIIGVDIFTQQVFLENIPSNIDIVLFFMIIILSMTFLIILFKFYQTLVKKIFFMSILIFFIFYISLFAFSSIEYDLKNIQNDFVSKNLNEDYSNYIEYYNKYENKKHFSLSYNNNSINKIEFTHFKDNQNISYIQIIIPNEYTQYWYKFNNFEMIHLQKDIKYKYVNDKLYFKNNKNITFIYELEENLDLNRKSISQEISKIMFIAKEENYYNIIHIEFLRLLNNIIFYSLSLFSYIVFFLKFNIYNKY